MFENSKAEKKPPARGRRFPARAALPAIADTDAHTDAGPIDPDTGARALIIVAVAIVAAFLVALARHIIVGVVVVLDDNAAAGLIAASVLVAHRANLLHNIGIGLFAADIDVGGLGAAGKTQCTDAGYQCHCESPHYRDPPGTALCDTKSWQPHSFRCGNGFPGRVP